MPKDERKRIKALVAVDLLGYPSISLALQAFCFAHDIVLVEDAAAAVGSIGEEGPCGTGGRIGIFSFNNNKIVTTGGGGAVLCKDDMDAEFIRHISSVSKKPSPWFYEHDREGYNYRPVNVCAAMGLGQLQRIEVSVGRKEALQKEYIKAFADWPDVGVLRDATGTRPNCWLNALMVDARFAHGAAEHRDAMLQELTNAGYGCRAMFTPLHTLEPYRGCPRQGNLKVAEDIFARTICIPSGV